MSRFKAFLTILCLSCVIAVGRQKEPARLAGADLQPDRCRSSERQVTPRPAGRQIFERQVIVQVVQRAGQRKIIARRWTDAPADGRGPGKVELQALRVLFGEGKGVVLAGGAASAVEPLRVGTLEDPGQR